MQNMSLRNMDTQEIGELGFSFVNTIILKSHHLLVKIDGSIDKAIDGYIRIRKHIKYHY
jgi:hypothetical protein